jgi:hypothetical protein
VDVPPDPGSGKVRSCGCSWVGFRIRQAALVAAARGLTRDQRGGFDANGLRRARGAPCTRGDGARGLELRESTEGGEQRVGAWHWQSGFIRVSAQVRVMARGHMAARLCAAGRWVRELRKEKICLSSYSCRSENSSKKTVMVAEKLGQLVQYPFQSEST